MSKIHRHAFERPLLRSRVKGHSHRRAGTECGEQQIVRRRPGIFPADLDWFIGGQPVWTDSDFLGEPGSVAAYDYIRGSHAQRYLCLDRSPIEEQASLTATQSAVLPSDSHA